MGLGRAENHPPRARVLRRLRRAAARGARRGRGPRAGVDHLAGRESLRAGLGDGDGGGARDGEMPRRRVRVWGRDHNFRHRRALDAQFRAFEERAVQHERLELPSFARAVAPERALDFAQRRARLGEGRAEVLLRVEAHRRHLDEHGVDVGVADEVQDRGLGLLPQVRQAHEAQVRAHSLDAKALVVAEDGAGADRPDTRHLRHHRREERPQVLHLVPRALRGTHLVRHLGVSRGASQTSPEEGQPRELAVRLHRVVADGLEAVRIELLHARVARKEVAQRDDAVAVRLSQHRRHHAVLPPGNKGNNIVPAHGEPAGRPPDRRRRVRRPRF